MFLFSDVHLHLKFSGAYFNCLMHFHPTKTMAECRYLCVDSVFVPLQYILRVISSVYRAMFRDPAFLSLRVLRLTTVIWTTCLSQTLDKEAYFSTNCLLLHILLRHLSPCH